MACPVLSSFAATWAAALPEGARRSNLLTVAAAAPNSDDALQTKRGAMCIDWLVRTYSPPCLTIGGFTAEATSLSSRSELTRRQDFQSAANELTTIRETVRAARLALNEPKTPLGFAAADGVSEALSTFAVLSARSAAIDGVWAAIGTQEQRKLLAWPTLLSTNDALWVGLWAGALAAATAAAPDRDSQIAAARDFITTSLASQLATFMTSADALFTRMAAAT